MKYEVTYTSDHTRAVEIGGVLWVPGEPQVLDEVPDEVLAMAEFGGHFVITEAKTTRKKKADEPPDPEA